jgi:hypothetical protein
MGESVTAEKMTECRLQVLQTAPPAAMTGHALEDENIS